MYTIRQILGTTLGLTMCGVKHDLNTTPSHNAKEQFDFSEKKAYAALLAMKGAKEKITADDITDLEMAKQLLLAADARIAS